jgi:hypothetical protein
VRQVFVGLGAKTSRRPATALLLAAAAHFLFIAILIWQARSGGERGSAQVIEVQLAPRQTPAPRIRSLRHPAPHPPAAPATRPASVERPAETQTPAATILPSQETQTQPPSLPSPATSSDASKALRAALGCNFAALANLTPDERQRCQARFTQNRPGAPVQEFGVAPAKQAIFEANAKRALWWQEPFLATTPKNGCAPKITNQQIVIPGGAHAPSDWRAGVSCGWSF